MVGLLALVVESAAPCRMKFDHCSADHFGDLGHDGVSEASQSVHPMGNPMSHSTHIGFSRPLFPASIRPRPPSPRTASVRDIPGCALLVAVFREPLPLASPAVGVGHIRTAMPSDGPGLPFVFPSL